MILLRPSCSKTFASANAYRTHILSRKHKETVAKFASASFTASPRGKGKVNASASAAAAASAPEASDASQGPVPLVFRVPHAPGSEPLQQAQAGASEVPAPVSGLDSVDSLRAALTSTAPASSAGGEASSSSSAAPLKQSRRSNLAVAADASAEEVQAAVDAKIASTVRIDPARQCLFCIAEPEPAYASTPAAAGPSSHSHSQQRFDSLESCLAHMQRVHSFFLPEREYLVDLPGLLSYLSDKICVGHICLYCNGRGRGFGSREAVQRHMLDKGHCKLAYDADEDKLELGDFYDFSSSYPDAERHRRKMERRRARREQKKGATAWQVIPEEDEDVSDINGPVPAQAADAEWEDDETEELSTDDDDDDSDATSSDGDSDEDATPQIRYGDSEYELVLPSGVRLGHRSMKRYYDQTLRTTPASTERYAGAGATQGGQLARRLLTNGRGSREEQDDRTGTLVRDRGGQLVRARNRGEAREAKRHVKEFRDVKRREQFKTQIGFRSNNQVRRTCVLVARIFADAHSLVAGV